MCVCMNFLTPFSLVMLATKVPSLVEHCNDLWLWGVLCCVVLDFVLHDNKSIINNKNTGNWSAQSAEHYQQTNIYDMHSDSSRPIIEYKRFWSLSSSEPFSIVLNRPHFNCLCLHSFKTTGTWLMSYELGTCQMTLRWFSPESFQHSVYFSEKEASHDWPLREQGIGQLQDVCPNGQLSTWRLPLPCCLRVSCCLFHSRTGSVPHSCALRTVGCSLVYKCCLHLVVWLCRLLRLYFRLSGNGL